jgi:hypothetical protein
MDISPVEFKIQINSCEPGSKSSIKTKGRTVTSAFIMISTNQDLADPPQPFQTAQSTLDTLLAHELGHLYAQTLGVQGGFNDLIAVQWENAVRIVPRLFH